MNRLRLAIRVLLKGQAALPPAAAPVRPERPQVSDVSEQLIALRDNVQAAAADLHGPGSQALNGVAGQLARILSGQQVVPFEDAGAFDARRHNAVASMATPDKALDYQVASSVRPGYLSNGALIRRQDVVVYRFGGDGGREVR
jgi:molecular chaperone GrpE (heat shock protein)